jgi:hypothetical protein
MSLLRFHAIGSWDDARVAVEWHERVWVPPADAVPLIDAAWARVTARPGVSLFDGPMCRMERWDAGDVLRLSLSRTGYKAFLGTNLSHPELADRLGRAALANPVGVSPALVTRDGFLLLGRRNARVAYYPNRLHPFAGSLEPRANLNVFDEVRRELHEELQLGPTDVARVVCTGIAEDVSIRQPELIFAAESTLGRDAILARLLDDEHHAGWSCPATAWGVEAALASGEPFTPVAIAALLLWGRSTFGVDWFNRAAAPYRA